MKSFKILSSLIITFCFSLFYSQNAQRPNIILIFADDLGYGDLSAYGQEKFSTPNIDMMAEKGQKFTSFYSGSTVCSPARSALLTGLHTGIAPVRGNKEVYPEGQYPLPQDVTTFSTLLQLNGYNTATFGKWGLGFVTSSGNPNWKGFDEFFGYICQRQAHDYFPTHLWHNDKKIELPENKVSDSIYSANLIHEKAKEYLAKQTKDKPFFMYLPYTLPHGSVNVPHKETYHKFVKKFDEENRPNKKLYKASYNKEVEQNPRAAFATMVVTLDRYVGEIIKMVKDKGMEDNTLIIFTSDNGPHNEGGADPEFFNSNGIYRGIKRDLYEGGIREPFIAYMPGKIKPNLIQEPFVLWDLFPTFLDFANVNHNYQGTGISLKPLFLNGKTDIKHDYLYWEFHEEGGKQAVRYGDWKGVRLNVNKGNKTIELYDLSKDPSEENDLSSQYPEIVNKISNFMDESRISNKDWPLLPEELAKTKK